MAKELLSKPDGFITMSIEEGEYVIDTIKKKVSHANIDDSVPYWTLNVENKKEGNIIR